MNFKALFEDINSKAEIFDKEAAKEEKYNVFSVLHKWHDERRLHSRFIATLLQPNGTHGQGDLFLKTFLEILDIEFPIDKYTEVYPTEWNKKEHHNIDIYLYNRIEKKAIVIENKIFAGDSVTNNGGQLYRYIQYNLNQQKISKDNLKVYYLSLDGHAPEESSLKRGKNKNGQSEEQEENYPAEMINCISYSDVIIPLLEKTIPNVPTQSFISDSLKQYLKLIKDMTNNNSSIEERQAYKTEIGKSEDNMRAAKKLYDNFTHIKWHSVHEFWWNLQTKLAKLENCKMLKTLDNDEITNITHSSDDKVLSNKKKSFMIKMEINEVPISIIFSTQVYGFYFGILNKDKNDTIINIAQNIQENHPEFQSNKEMLLFKEFNTNINFNNFHDQQTFDIIDPVKSMEYVDSAVEEIKSLIDNISNIK